MDRSVTTRKPQNLNRKFDLSTFNGLKRSMALFKQQVTEHLTRRLVLNLYSESYAVKTRF